MKKAMQVISIILLVLCIFAVIFCIGVCITMMVKDMSFVDVCKELVDCIKSWFVKPKNDAPVKEILSFVGVI